MKHAIAAALIFAAHPAPAEPVCTDRARALSLLEGQFGERVVGRGTSGPTMVEMFASDRGSWTFVVIFADGRTCLMASGHDWHEIKPRPNL